MGQDTGAGRPPIQVAIADKNPMVLANLSELFDRDGRFSLALTVTTAERLLEGIARARIDVAVVGWVLPRLGGARLLEALRDRAEAPRVVVYTGSEDADLPRRVMAAGGAGFCAKNEPPERLLETVQAVAEGRMVFPFVDVRALKRASGESLTERERVLLAALAKGLTNVELARHLGISVNTVKFHLRNLYDKLSIRNRAQAVARYYASGEFTGADD